MDSRKALFERFNPYVLNNDFKDECPICEESYSNDRLPLLLKCGGNKIRHMYCKVCMIRTRCRYDYVKCPFCRISTKISEITFDSNNVVIGPPDPVLEIYDKYMEKMKGTRIANIIEHKVSMAILEDPEMDIQCFIDEVYKIYGEFLLEKLDNEIIDDYLRRITLMLKTYIKVMKKLTNRQTETKKSAAVNLAISNPFRRRGGMILRRRRNEN